MYEPQHLLDLEQNSSFGDQNSWLSARRTSSSRLHAAAPAPSSSVPGSNVDRVLFNDLVEMVPLVQELIDRKASSSFTRRGSVVYTRTPSRESMLPKKMDSKGRNASQAIPAKKKKDPGDKDQGKGSSDNQDDDSFSIFSSRTLTTEKEMEELITLRQQVEDLQKKLLEKDELLKSAEASKDQLNAVHSKFDELKQREAEKDSLIKSVQLQLSDTKIKLADKQAALEKMQWELMTSNKKVEKLQEEVDSMQGGISLVSRLFEGLVKKDPTMFCDDYDIKPCYLEHLPDIDDWDDAKMQKMEEAREAYVAAVAAAKEKQDEESIAGAARARLHLQSLVFRSDNSINASKVCSNGVVSRTSYGAYVQ